MSINNQPSHNANVFFRVRKPPGGDTNDIFNMEMRQKIYSDQRLCESSKDSGKTESFESEKCIPHSNSCSTCIHSREFNNSNKIFSADELNKENMNMLADVTEEIPKYKLNEISDENFIEEVKEIEDNDDQEIFRKKYVSLNPITGEKLELDVTPRSKLKDCSNKAQCLDEQPKNTSDYGLTRPSIRVRQPPGGRSSHIF